MDYTNTMNSLRAAAPATGDARTGGYRPRLSFYHPNAKGTGCAVQLELHPAHDDVGGSLMLFAASQSAIGNRQGPNPTYARFDWENKICVKLDFNDLCQFLLVFRGAAEAANDGRGMFHRSPRGTTRIVLKHLVEPVVGYSLELYRTSADGQAESRAHILLTDAEAHGLCEAIAGSMAVIAFGLPVVIPHDTSAYREKVREVRNANAA